MFNIVLANCDIFDRICPYDFPQQPHVMKRVHERCWVSDSSSISRTHTTELSRWCHFKEYCYLLRFADPAQWLLDSSVDHWCVNTGCAAVTLVHSYFVCVMTIRTSLKCQTRVVRAHIDQLYRNQSSLWRHYTVLGSPLKSLFMS